MAAVTLVFPTYAPNHGGNQHYHEPQEIKELLHFFELSPSENTATRHYTLAVSILAFMCRTED